MIKYSLNSINRSTQQDAQAFALECEENYKQVIKRTAQFLIENSEKYPIVLLSGPSGSGKTTTALRLASYLEGWGHTALTLSLDNYFDRRPDQEIPLDDEGNVDLESPKFVDVPLLAQHLETLANGGAVQVPRFDFKNQCRRRETVEVVRHPGELVILEGIHSLIPEVTGTTDGYAVGLYVSVRTRLVEGDEVLLHPQKIRLLRRLIRNELYRGETFAETVSRMRSVNRGENLYIMPYKERAKLQIDTFLPYEIGVLTGLTRAELRALPDSVIESAGIDDLLYVLNNASPIDPECVPGDSLIREFIGGSVLHY